MRNLWILRVLGAIVLLIGVVAVGVIAYNAGVAQGQTVVPAVAIHRTVAGRHGRACVWRADLPAVPVLPRAALPVLLHLPAFADDLRAAPDGDAYARALRGEEGSVPPPFEEWHRRMHEKTDKPS